MNCFIYFFVAESLNTLLNFVENILYFVLSNNMYIFLLRFTMIEIDIENQ